MATAMRSRLAHFVSLALPAALGLAHFVSPATAQGSCAAALEHVRAVFGSASATQTYATLRSAGRSALESVLGAQDDPGARAAIRACESEVVAYLETLIGAPPNPAAPVRANLPTVAPGCVDVRWSDDFATVTAALPTPAQGQPAPGGGPTEAPEWRVTASLINNCTKPVLVGFCIAYKDAGAEAPDRRAYLIDRPIVAEYPFATVSFPAPEYFADYTVCEIDETCNAACAPPVRD
jgi:hypothetical protein